MMATRIAWWTTCAVAFISLVAREQDAAPSLQSLEKTRYEAAQAVWDTAAKRMMTTEDGFGDQDFEAKARWSLRIAESAIAASVLSPHAAYESHLERMVTLAKPMRAMAEMGRRSQLAVAVAEFFVADAKVRVATAK